MTTTVDENDDPNDGDEALPAAANAAHRWTVGDDGGHSDSDGANDGRYEI